MRITRIDTDTNTEIKVTNELVTDTIYTFLMGRIPPKPNCFHSFFHPTVGPSTPQAHTVSFCFYDSLGPWDLKPKWLFPFLCAACYSHE